MITLYLKTHNKTGLKYLGKTTQDPFTYKGSGIKWKRHLNKHGHDVATEILFESNDKDEFKKVALQYSKKLDIVDSPEFANLTLEEGQGGYTSYSEERNDRISKALSGVKKMTGWHHSEETKLKISKSHEGRVYPKHSEESRAKMSASRKGQTPWNKGVKHSDEHRTKIGAAQRGVPKPKVECPHCKTMIANNLKNRWHFDNCKLKGDNK